ncbi:GrpB family protein [Gottfriedia luciferensis]|uniref:GrpB family protein n=1 Tax=Gottfriedia luciferensis TaxID=178774 RepID=UPI000B434620|nr:GrpB family protein [Gottfriedia luciferensis]
MNVIVTNHNENWNKLFQEDAKLIRDILKDELVEIHHIGSTSVPNLKAKPIIDMLPVVKNIKNIDMYNEKMAEIGYEGLGEFGLTGRRYFRKGGDNRTHQLHMYQFDNETEIERHLAVPAYLRAHDDAAKAYGELKAKLAEQFPNDITGYMDGKDAFVKDIERKAIAWRKSNNLNYSINSVGR